MAKYWRASLLDSDRMGISPRDLIGAGKVTLTEEQLQDGFLHEEQTLLLFGKWEKNFQRKGNTKTQEIPVIIYPFSFKAKVRHYKPANSSE